jgi:hypothetical protein
MHSTEMCLQHLSERSGGAALINAMSSAPGEQLLVNCFAQGQNSRFFSQFAGSGIQTSNLSVTGPMLLTISVAVE